MANYTYTDIFIKNLEHNRRRINSNFIDISPEINIFEDNSLVPCRASCLPDYSSLGDKMSENNFGKSI